MDDAAFLAALHDHPEDDATRLVYADWLEERGDPRAEYLRLGVAIAEHLRRGQGYADLRQRLLELSSSLPREWREQAGKRFDVILVSASSLLDTIGALRKFTGRGIADAKHLIGTISTNGPKRVQHNLLLEDAEQLKENLEIGRWHENMNPLSTDESRCSVVIKESNPARPVPQFRVTVLGSTAGNNTLQRLGLQVNANTPPTAGDLVLIAVSGRDGPLTGFVEALNLATGFIAHHVALLLTEIDKDLQEARISLAESETRNLLDAVRAFPEQVAQHIPCFRIDDPELQSDLLAWSESPPAPLQFQHAEMPPDW